MKKVITKFERMRKSSCVRPSICLGTNKRLRVAPCRKDDVRGIPAHAKKVVAEWTEIQIEGDWRDESEVLR